VRWGLEMTKYKNIYLNGIIQGRRFITNSIELVLESGAKTTLFVETVFWPQFAVMFDEHQNYKLYHSDYLENELLKILRDKDLI
jgi:hypothetical protein